MNEKSNKRSMVKTITITGMMIAITIIMGTTVFGTIRIGTVDATIAHIPTIILAILEGPLCGFIGGLALGIISMLVCLLSPSLPLHVFIANPLISVLPRIFIGLVAYYVYAGVSAILKNKKARVPVAVALGAAFGSITNTVGVLGMLYLVYAERIGTLMAENGMAGVSVAVFLVGIATVQGVLEMIITTVLSVIVTIALKKAGFGRVE